MISLQMNKLKNLLTKILIQILFGGEKKVHLIKHALYINVIGKKKLLLTK